MYDPDTGKGVEIMMDQGQYVLDLWVPKTGPEKQPGPASSFAGQVS